MTTANKYRPNGTLYTSTELAIKRHKSTPKYIVRHPMPGIGALPGKPYNQGRNANKRLLRRLRGVRK